ncbi:MAG TPA: DUF4258 domain-containing protein [Nitrospira sp.]|jgi:hypothetical protein|uniref:DUF4258 domain-containing protein n=1 Tax=Nitrospira cf. moscoviensis SBR1015 TaxID=96242 RepID=UPI000A0EB712|nr:DUF4258 domain-containing protein [Nitrospira cf. moscoviensis SBR1015]MBL8074229.1 DUF4258 domain-containing protein [Nitrospira sp.]OQW38914.1 MAG: hypothetical protein A4C66_02610 [Nitrospira sp. HN-bin3]MBS0167380.1 DUF4258 domain-containing protein [Nitrospira sp.]MBX3327719.1 DUF4258 domain-containing protein [Nitrospira sp.]HBH78394.1 DUF4258 domain-containing protein [Nitrospira sp.]
MVRCDQESDEGKNPPALSVTDISALARAVLEGSCSLIPTDHFKKRSRERDFSVQDALEVFHTGTVSSAPIWNDKTKSWNYDIAGIDLNGDELTVRVAPSKQGLVLVTAF